MTNSKINSSPLQTWDNSYLLDIPEIDKQHMYFFKLFDQLLLLNNSPEDYQKIETVIEELEKYTHNHFKEEETLMRSANSNDIESHLIQHNIFIKKLDDFKTAYNYKNNVLIDQMIVFMRKWFFMHISEVDGKYAESVRNYLSNKSV